MHHRQIGGTCRGGHRDAAADIRALKCTGHRRHRIAVDGAGRREIGAAESGRGGAVIGLGHAAAHRAHRDRGRDAVEQTVAGGLCRSRLIGGVVLEEIRREAVNGVRRRIGGIDQPSSSGASGHRRRARLIDEVSAGAERDPGAAVNGSARGDGQIAAGRIHRHGARTVDGRVHVDSVIGRQRQAGRRITPADRRVHIDVTRACALRTAARRARGRGRLGDAGSGIQCAIDGRGRRRVDGQIDRIDHPGAAASSADARALRDFERGTRGLDDAPGGCRRGRRRAGARR